MSEEIETLTVNGTVFELQPIGESSGTPGHVRVRKPRSYIDRYELVAEEFNNCRMVEVGVYEGGSTAFFSKLFQPRGLLSIDLSDEPVELLENFLKEHDTENKVNVQWGVDQSDPVRVPELVNETFGDAPLDLVVDDASHLLEQTTATFEMLFPRMRPGGLYIIEDWSWRHLRERGMSQAKTMNKVATEKIAAALADDREYEIPMSLLICQLVVASGFQLDWVTSVRTIDGFCEIRRGDGDIPPNTPISEYIGYHGNRMLKTKDA